MSGRRGSLKCGRLIDILKGIGEPEMSKILLLKRIPSRNSIAKGNKKRGIAETERLSEIRKECKLAWKTREEHNVPNGPMDCTAVVKKRSELAM